MTTDLTCAETILTQLGGSRRLTAMIGAKHFAGDQNSLTFKFAAPAMNKANCIVVRLDPSDTYTVEFWRIRGTNAAKVDEQDMVYCDVLRGVIESKTGLRLSL